MRDLYGDRFYFNLAAAGWLSDQLAGWQTGLWVVDCAGERVDVSNETESRNTSYGPAEQHNSAQICSVAAAAAATLLWLAALFLFLAKSYTATSAEAEVEAVAATGWNLEERATDKL